MRQRFTVAKLLDYLLIEALPGHYSVHACVHDWVWGYLNGEFQMKLFCLAIECVAQNVKKESEPEFWLVNGRLIHHALRIDYCQRRGDVNWEDIDTDSLYNIAYLDNMMGRLTKAEKMYMRALKGKGKAWGAEHISTLNTVNNS
jgi:hypothetical protein